MKRIFIISLDGATFDVLGPLMEQGCMPNLLRLMERGTSAELESVIPPVTAPAWTSFMTGKMPSKHGIFDFTRFDPRDYGWKLNNSQHIASKTIWQILSEQGKRSIVLGLPFTYPPYPINGIVVSGWDSPSTEATFTYPPELGGKVLELIPDYESTLNLFLWDYMPTNSDEHFGLFVRKLIRGFEQGTELALHFLEGESWDVFMVHFQQTDYIQHKLWNYIEAACSDRANREKRVEATRNCYRRFDELIGALLRRVEPISPTRIILSDHGFGPYKGAICPNYFLYRWGHLSLTVEPEDRLKPLKDFFRKSRHAPLRKFYSALARAKNSRRREPVFEKYKSWTQFANETFPRQKLPIDWGKSRAVTIVANQTAFIYINLVGRGPSGVVEPGPQYQALVSELISRFKQIAHPVTGERLIAEAARGADIYPEACEGILLPDLVLIPADGYGFSTSVSDEPPTPTTAGLHRRNGILIIEGEDVVSSAAPLRPRILDLAPTILHMLGLPVPADMDGRVLEEILVPGEKVRYQQADNRLAVTSKIDYNPEESELIEQRLRGLGYLE